jgi:DNA-binding IclR family transcriptional regulator
MKKAAADGAQTIRRAVALLRAISRGSSGGRRLKDLAHAVDLAQPTAHRILKALIDEQVVTQDASTKLYGIGRLVFELGIARGPYESTLVELCRPHLRNAASVSGDTCYLSIRSGVDSVCLDRAEGSYPVRVLTVEVGGRLPLGAGTGGVALLAALDDTEVEQVLGAIAADLESYNKLTVDEVRERVRLTRLAGFVDIRNKPLTDVRGIGVTVPNRAGAPHLAISIAAIQDRIPDRRVPQIRELLEETGHNIAAALAANEI